MFVQVFAHQELSHGLQDTHRLLFALFLAINKQSASVSPKELQYLTTGVPSCAMGRSLEAVAVDDLRGTGPPSLTGSPFLPPAGLFSFMTDPFCCPPPAPLAMPLCCCAPMHFTQR